MLEESQAFGIVMWCDVIYGVQKCSATNARASKSTVPKNVQRVFNPIAMAFSVDHYVLCGTLWNNDTFHVFI